MSNDPYVQQEALLGRIDRTLGRMVDTGLQGDDVYTALDQSRRGVASNLPGMPGYDSSERAAESYMQQADERIASANRTRAANDPEFAAAACDCVPGEPCCLRSFEVEDSEDGSRKVAWPVPQDGPTRLYVIAKDPVAGQPSAKAKVTLTDKDPCQLNFARPSVNPTGHAAGPEFIRESDEITVTTPFQLPGFHSTMLPPEMMTVIYLSGLLLQVRAYQNHDGAMANPYQCMVPRVQGLEVFPLPHCDISAEATGSISLSIPIGRAPTFTVGVACEVTGEVGNQTLQYSSGAEQISRPKSPDPQGPINHPLFDYLDSIQDAMSGLADEGNRRPVPRAVPSPSALFTLNVGFSASIGIPGVKLEPKTGSPNLQLTLDAFSLSMGPSVSGTLDLLGLLLAYVPNGNAIRDALAHRGNTLRVEAKLEITVGGSGTGTFNLENTLQVEVGDIDQLEADLSQASTVLTGSCELTANVRALAEIELDTWLLDAYAAAGANADTGWQFGARVRGTGGARVYERMHHFQGLIVSGYAEAGLGSGTSNRDTSDPLAGLSSDTREVVNRTTDAFSARSNMGRPSFRAVLLEPSGGEDTWYEV